jgi:hypothetical protein
MDGFRAIDWLARIGFIVKGVLYMVIGVLALQVAASAGGRITGTRGALTTVLRQPFGRTLLLGAAIGLLGYAAWRVIQAVLDTDRRGRDWSGLAVRASFIVRGVVHGALGWQAFRLNRGLSASSDGGREVTAEAFQWPLGDWLVVLAGLGLLGLAAQQIYAAVTGHFERNLKVTELRREAGNWAVALSRFGIAARAVVFALLGCSIVLAGWSRDPSEAGTMASSLATLAEQPGAVGRWMFGLTAAGFVAYGFYEVVHVRYLRIQRVR